MKSSKTLDNFIIRHETSPIVDGGNVCSYSLGKNPTGRIKCTTCTELADLMDLETSWTQLVDYGHMKGREIELVEVKPVISFESAKASRKTYLLLDNHQRDKSQAYFRKYIAMFKCNGKNYVLREKVPPLIESKTIPLPVALAQLIELFSSLPQNFAHGNPTVSSLFSKRVKQPVKHFINENIEYETKDLLQVDYGVTTSGFTTTQKTGQSDIILENERYYYIIPNAEFESFITEYPKFQPSLGFHFFAASLLSLYDEREQKSFENLLNNGPPIKGKNLKEAFYEMRGRKMRKDAVEVILENIKPALETVSLRERF